MAEPRKIATFSVKNRLRGSITALYLLLGVCSEKSTPGLGWKSVLAETTSRPSEKNARKAWDVKVKKERDASAARWGKARNALSDRARASKRALLVKVLEKYPDLAYATVPKGRKPPCKPPRPGAKTYSVRQISDYEVAVCEK